MKKFTSIATLLAATAFCGLCTGCATAIANKNEAPAAPVSVTASDSASTHKVILNPGWNYSGSQKKLNTITDAGVTAADAATYFVDNAYIANYATGENLPAATPGKSGLTFVGWRYASEGELITVTTMPNVNTLTSDLYLYAEWKTGSGSSGGNTGGGGGGSGSQDTIPSNAVQIVFGGGEKVTIKLTNTNGKSNIRLYAWNGSSTVGNWPGVAVSLGEATTISLPLSGTKIIFNWGGASDNEKTGDISYAFADGGTYTISLTKATTTVTQG